MGYIQSHVKQFWFLHSSWLLAFAHFMIPSVNTFIETHPHSMEAGIAALVVARLTQAQLTPAK
jgi:hypothetical protein